MPKYNQAKFGGNWTTNKGETEGGDPPSPDGTEIPQAELG